MAGARGEAMLQLFQMKWTDLSQKMPELAEAGYTSLWLPQPAKASGALSVGYDIFDPFDLGDKNQNGTTATLYGTKAELLQMVQTAHRFGIRVYFDNVMNHRQGVVPGYDVLHANEFLPRAVAAGFPSADHQQRQPELAERPELERPVVRAERADQRPVRPGHGAGHASTSTLAPRCSATTNKPFFIRQPNNPEYYMDTNTVLLGSWPSGGMLRQRRVL